MRATRQSNSQAGESTASRRQPCQLSLSLWAGPACGIGRRDPEWLDTVRLYWLAANWRVGLTSTKSRQPVLRQHGERQLNDYTGAGVRVESASHGYYQQAGKLSVMLTSATTEYSVKK